MIGDFALVIGAMRCGTTSLFEYLSGHPQVAACSEKEPDFFARDATWSRGFDWYERMWDFDPARHRVALEASTNYSKLSLFPSTVERIASTPARFRFIYLMRHPIDRIESHYVLGAAKGWPESRRPLAEYVHPDLVEFTRYAKQLDAYRARFPRERMLLLAFEDLVRRPREVLREVCRFLEIDPAHEFQGLDVVHNSNLGRRPGDPGQLLYRARLWIPFWMRIARSVSPERRNALRRRFARPDVRPPRLSPEQRAHVLKELEDDLARLEGEYGFDTSPWRLAREPAGAVA